MQPVLTVPRIVLTVPPARARALAVALATANHTWLRGALLLPEAPTTLEAAVKAADLIEASGVWSNGDRGTTDLTERQFWRPDAKVSGGVFVWRPWSGGDRRIEIHPDGRVVLEAGSCPSPWGLGGSTFLGAVAVAVSGGLAHLPHGVVHLRAARSELPSSVPVMS